MMSYLIANVAFAIPVFDLKIPESSICNRLSSIPAIGSADRAKWRLKT